MIYSVLSKKLESNQKKFREHYSEQCSENLFCWVYQVDIRELKNTNNSIAIDGLLNIIKCLPHQPDFSDIFDLCLHWVSVVRGFLLKIKININIEKKKILGAM